MSNLSSFPPSSAQTSTIPADAWKNTANGWTPQQAKLQYALHELGLSTADALAYSTKQPPLEELANIKSWHHNLKKPALEEAEIRTQIREQLISVSENITSENIQDKVQAVAQLERDFGFEALKTEATGLTLNQNPIVGLLVGSYMFNSGNRRDGNALFTLGLRPLTESPEGIKQSADLGNILENHFLGQRW